MTLMPLLCIKDQSTSALQLYQDSLPLKDNVISLLQVRSIIVNRSRPVLGAQETVIRIVEVKALETALF